VSPSGASKVALDLGAGSGIQLVALRILGFEVYAVDMNEELLNEFKNRK
jgi:2-polyprenyl-3-methyl-5-hydroxy-6-metoxy-1,4-benzoquinol methylase